MNEYDGYVEDYLIRFFRNMPSVFIPRNIALENQIIRAGKIEYLLNSSIENFMKAFKQNWLNINNKKFCINIERTTKGGIVVEPKEQFRTLMAQQRLTLLDLLGCTQNNNSRQEYQNKFELIKLYQIYRKIDLNSDAVDLLSRELDVTPDTIIEPVFNIKSCTLRIGQTFDFFRLWHFFNVNSNLSNCFAITRYLDNKKVMLPLHWSQAPQLSWTFFPGAQPPFFNQSRLDNNLRSIVLLTDSIELAGINQRNLDCAMVADIAWLSWYGERNAVEKMDWSLLKGCRVYYLLLEHSGFGGKTVYETALAVKRKLDTVGVAEFKFISYLAAGIDYVEQSKVAAPIPTIYSADEFEPAMARERQTLPPAFATFQNDLARLTRGRKVLLTPLIRERSATLIWGMPKSGKTWFAANMALAMALGKPAFQNWSPLAHRSTILYIHGESEGDISLEEKLTVLSKTLSAHTPITINPNAFLSERTMQPVVYVNNLPINYYVQLLDTRWPQPDLELYSAIICLSKTIEKSVPPGVIILDDVFFSSPQTWALQNMLIRDLKSAGWAIIIVAGPQLAPVGIGFSALLNSQAVVHKATPEFIDHAQVDSIIKIKKRSCKDGKLTIGVKIESPWVNADDSKFDCYLDSIANPPVFEHVKREKTRWPEPLKKPRIELVREVTELHQKGFKGQQIADKLRITLSMVKKIKREWGLSKPRVKKNFVSAIKVPVVMEPFALHWP